MRYPEIATACVLVLLAGAEARASAPARAEMLADYGEASPEPLGGEGGQQVIINGQSSELPMQLPGMGPRQP